MNSMKNWTMLYFKTHSINISYLFGKKYFTSLINEGWISNILSLKANALMYPGSLCKAAMMCPKQSMYSFKINRTESSWSRQSQCFGLTRKPWKNQSGKIVTSILLWISYIFFHLKKISYNYCTSWKATKANSKSLIFIACDPSFCHIITSLPSIRSA